MLGRVQGSTADVVHVLYPLAACRNHHQGCLQNEKDGLTISQKNRSLIAALETENAGQIRNNQDCVGVGTRNNDGKNRGHGRVFLIRFSGVVAT